VKIIPKYNWKTLEKPYNLGWMTGYLMGTGFVICLTIHIYYGLIIFGFGYGFHLIKKKESS